MNRQEQARFLEPTDYLFEVPACSALTRAFQCDGRSVGSPAISTMLAGEPGNGAGGWAGARPRLGQPKDQAAKYKQPKRLVHAFFPWGPLK